MSENKTATQAAVDEQRNPGTTPVAKLTAVTDEKIQNDYRALVETLGWEETTPSAERVEEGHSMDFAHDLGQALHDETLIARFEGVKENLAREIRSGMCTVDQAYAYLENIEISLLLEQEAAVKA